MTGSSATKISTHVHGFTVGMGFELMRRVIAPLLMIVMIPFLVWIHLGPDKPKSDAPRSLVAAEAAQKVATVLREHRQDVRRVAILHFANDPTDEVTTQVRRVLLESGVFPNAEGNSFAENLRGLLNLRNPGVTADVEKARDYARQNGFDAVLVGEVDCFETVNGEGRLQGRIRFVRASGESVEIPLGGKSGAPAEDSGPVALGGRSIGCGGHVLLMFLGILFLPVLSFPFLVRVMKRASNMSTLLALLVLLMGDGFFIHTAFPGVMGVWGHLAIAAVYLLAVLYDLFMLSFAQLRGPVAPR